MKKLLLIIILAILATGVSYFIEMTPPGQFDASTSFRGLIIPYWSQTHATYDFGTGQFPIFPPKWNWIVFVLDIFLWTVFVMIIWSLIRMFRKFLKL